MHPLASVFTVAAVACTGVLLHACVFDLPVGHARGQAYTAEPLPPDGPIDILFVVDNSGSMLEEQERLARTLFNTDCPIASLVQVPETLQNPDAETLATLQQRCGFAQILAAYDRDFRIGVITTDVNACDNFVPQAQGGTAYGYHPQRGCLQPVPSTGQRFIQRSDVDIQGRFEELLVDVRTFGSPFERGFDAVDAFLDGDTFVESCAGDRDLFLRPDAALLLVFVTDEDDCSHADGAYGFSSETATTCTTSIEVVTEHQPQDCYTHPEQLAPVAGYAERWRALKGAGREDAVRVAMLVGSTLVDGAAVAGGCALQDDGAVTADCRASGGLSNFTDPGAPCDPNGPDGACCTADAGRRYFALAALMATDASGSICAPSYVPTLMGAVTLAGEP